MLKKLEDIESSVAILSQCSDRDLTSDVNVRQLAVRLDGLPLALATAGIYLGQTNISCAEYLHVYETAWTDLHASDSEELLEYEDRTLSSTWVISFNQVCRLDPDAGELFKFWAYFSKKDIWYELIQAGAEGSAWIGRVTTSKIRFDRAMTRLRDYSLVEVTAGSYSIHPCVHTWISEYFDADMTAFLDASHCIMVSIPDAASAIYWATTQRLLPHINRLNGKRYRAFWEASSSDESILNLSHAMGVLFMRSSLVQGEEMYLRALAGYNAKLGCSHPSTLHVIHNLGILYAAQGEFKLAEEMFKQALSGYEKSIGRGHIWTLNAASNLGNSYMDRGKLKEAEEIRVRALEGNSAILGPTHILTLNTIMNIGTLYHKQGRLEEAEEMYLRALSGTESLLGSGHPAALDMTNHLGNLHRDQKKLRQAEEMYSRTLTEWEVLMGPNHFFTLMTVQNLGNVYRDQGKVDEAEKSYYRVLLSCEGADIDEKWSETRENLARILRTSTRAQMCGIQNARRRLARSIRYFQHSNATLRFYLRYSLARALLWIEDGENFPIAFSQVESALCDGCEKEINIARGPHVCLACEDTDLCDNCMVKYDSKILQLTERDCSGHRFVNVGSMVSKPVNKMSAAEEDAWIEKLKQKYPVIEDD